MDTETEMRSLLQVEKIDTTDVVFKEFRDVDFSEAKTRTFVTKWQEKSLEANSLLLVGVTFENVATFACLMQGIAKSVFRLRFTNCNLNSLAYLSVLTETFPPGQLNNLQIVEGNPLSREPDRRSQPFKGPEARQIFCDLAQSTKESFRLQLGHAEDDYEAILGGIKDGSQNREKKLSVEFSILFLPESMQRNVQAIVDSAVVTDFYFASATWNGKTSRQSMPILLQTPTLHSLQIEFIPCLDFDNCTCDESQRLVQAIAQSPLKTLQIIVHEDPGVERGKTFFTVLFQALALPESRLEHLCLVLEEVRYRVAICQLLQEYMPRMKNLRVLRLLSCHESRRCLLKGIQNNESLCEVLYPLAKKDSPFEPFLKRNRLIQETRGWCKEKLTNNACLPAEDLLSRLQSLKKSTGPSFTAIYSLVREHLPPVASQIHPLLSRWERIKMALPFWRRRERRRNKRSRQLQT